MNRSALVRRKRLTGRYEGPATSKRRAGLTKAEEKILEDLHRDCVMSRWAAQGGRIYSLAKLSGQGHTWFGQCEHCGNTRQLYDCHIMPKGQYRRLRFDPENAWAGCSYCHIHWWHKNPTEASAWITARIGPQKMQMLSLRAKTAGKISFSVTKLYLEKFLTTLQPR